MARTHGRWMAALLTFGTILFASGPWNGTTRAAGLLKPASGGEPLALDTHHVSVEISDGIAATEVVQIFRNDGAAPLEAVYSFPLPPESSLAGFSMWIDDEEVTGEVLERDHARSIYEEIVHPAVPSQQQARWEAREMALKDPGLVEEVSYREFQVTIFPVPARGTQKVRLLYYQYLTAEEDRITYVYPMETRVMEDSRATGRFRLDMNLRSVVPISEYVFARELDDQITGEASDPHHLTARLDRPDGDLDRDFVMTYSLGRTEPGLDVVSYRSPGVHGFFMALATAPVGETVEAPVDYTFVVDVSGSMRRQRRLEIAGQGIARFLAGCRDDDRFNVIAFNVEPHPLSAEFLPNNHASRDAMRDYLARFRGVGGTDLFPALELAYGQENAGRRQAIIVVTDGGLNDLDEDHARFLDLAGGRPATIFGLALGNDANLPLLQALAAQTGGFVTQISNQDDLEARGDLLRKRMRYEPLRDLRLSVQGDVQLADLVPARIPDLYPGQQVAVLGRYRGAGAATFRLGARRGERPVVLEASVDLPREDLLNPEIRRLWAERKAFDLMQGHRAGRLPESVEDLVVGLGVTYSIVTPLTSFIVLESDEMFRRYGIERRTRALLEEESEARAQRARAIDAETVRAENKPRRSSPMDSFAGAVDPFALILIAVVLLGPFVKRWLLS